MMPLGQVFDALSKAGFTGAEVMVTSDQVTQEGAGLRALSEDFGIAVEAIHAPFLLLTRTVFTTDPLEKIRRSTGLAQDIGAPLVVVHPAYRWQQRFHRWLGQDIAEFSRSEAITLAVENMFPVWVRGRALQFHRSMSIEDMKRFSTVVLDTSHAAVTGIDVIRAFDELGDRIRHIHLSNNLGTGRDTHSPLTNGVLPIGRLLERIAGAGFTGTITLELDVREWLGKPGQLVGQLRRQREFCLDRLGAAAGA